MKVLILENDNDGGGAGIDLAVRALRAGHDVRYWLPVENGTGRLRPHGDGMLEKPKDWKPSMDWAELIVLTNNTLYSGELAEYIGKGYPVFGANQKSAALELDREQGQRVLEDYGVPTLPYKLAGSVDEAIRMVADSKKVYCLKPWGGESDKSMTCVPRTVDEAVQILHKWKEKKLKGQLMLQEKVQGIEMGISGFFGPGGWNRALEESFEFKRFMNDDVGGNTGEMGTVIRHVQKSRLFDEILDPLTDYLHGCRYVGDCAVNVIIDDSGNPWPLEFTARLGWPDFCIRQEVIKSDPVEWMADLLLGQDTLRVSTDVAVGVVMAHGDYPRQKDPVGAWAGYPIVYSEKDEEHIHWQDVMEGTAPCAEKGSIVRKECKLTAGPYILVVSHHGKSVSEAQRGAYEVLREIRIPSNTMHRTDIGARLELELPKLQKLGYAVGLKY